MTTGRRPNGLCGAAIFIAAKMHAFKVKPEQITSVVHVCDETMRQRVVEFKDTKTAQLTRQEFKELEMKEKDPFKFDYECPEVSQKMIREEV